MVSVIPDYGIPWQSNRALLLADGGVSNTLPVTNATLYNLTYKVTHAPYLVGTVGWWPFDTDASDIFGGHDGLLCGDPVFSGGRRILFADDFRGPTLNPIWQASLPPARSGNFCPGGCATINYIGAPNYGFQNIAGASVLRMTNILHTSTR